MLYDRNEKMKKTLSAAFLLFMFLLVGCSTPQALVHPQQGVIDFQPTPGKAYLVVIRERMLKGSIGNWSVSLDGREVSRLSIGNYLAKEIEPGEHSLSNVAWVESPTIFSAEPNKVYYFNYDLPIFGSNAFDPMKEKDARALMEKYIRVKLLY